MCCHSLALWQPGLTRMLSKTPQAGQCKAISLSMQDANSCRNVLCFCSIPEVSCCVETSWIQGRWIIDMPALGRKSKARLEKGKGPLSEVNCIKIRTFGSQGAAHNEEESGCLWPVQVIKHSSWVIQGIPLISPPGRGTHHPQAQIPGQIPCGQADLQELGVGGSHSRGSALCDHPDRGTTDTLGGSVGADRDQTHRISVLIPVSDLQRSPQGCCELHTVSKASVSISGDKTSPVIFQQCAKPLETAHLPVPSERVEKNRLFMSSSWGTQLPNNAKKIKPTSGAELVWKTFHWGTLQEVHSSKQHHCALTRSSGLRPVEWRN